MDFFRSKSNTHEVEHKKASQARSVANSDRYVENVEKLQDEGSDSLIPTTSNIDGSTILSLPVHSGDDASNIEYSADIKPLTFNVNNSIMDRETESVGDSHFRRSMSMVREKLSKNNGSYDKREAMIRSLFGSIDREQFENYLREPRYIKMLKRGKNLKQFRRLFLAQELVHSDQFSKEARSSAPSLNTEKGSNAVWVTKFSLDGNYMASGGKDGVLRLWKVISSPLERWHLDFTEENIQELKAKTSLLKQQNASSASTSIPPSGTGKEGNKNEGHRKIGVKNLYAPVFHPTPSNVLKHHTSDILDISWSKNNFIATASMDKTVCLWHPERSQPLKSFTHPDFVTCVAFHPTDDRFLITGCLDHKCRLWSILDDEVAFEYDCQDLITSIALSTDDANHTFVGTFNGFVYVLATKGLDYIRSFHVTDKETQDEVPKSKYVNSSSKIHHGPRIICLQSYEDTVGKTMRLIVTSNDSRIRVFDVKTKKCLEILKGFQSGSSQTNSQSSILRDKAVVVCGSEDHWVYAWKIKAQGNGKHSTEKESDYTSKRQSFKGFFSHNKDGGNIDHSKHEQHYGSNHHSHNPLHLRNLFPHPSSGTNDQAIKNSYSMSFHAHHAPVTTVNVAPPVTTKLLSLSNDLICELSLQFYMESDTLEIIGDRRQRKSMDHESDSSSISSTTSTSSMSRPSSLNDFLRIDEETAHEQALPSVVDAIGTIMVTTDSTGVIRVFRADLPANIRKRVLKKLKEYRSTEENQKKNANSEFSLNTPGQNSTRSIATMTGMTAATPRTCPAAVEEAIAAPSRRIRAGSVFKNSIFNHSNGSLHSSRTNRGSAASVAPVEDTFRKASMNNHMSGIGNASKLRCDVCNGTKFGTTSAASQSSHDAGDYCLDCGSMPNNFR